MRAGRLDRRISIQTATDGTADEFGVVPKTWETTMTAWAEDVTNKRKGRALYNGAIESHELDKVFLVRYEVGQTVNADQRIQYEGINYRIASPPIEAGSRYEGMIIACQRWGTDS